MGAKNAKSISSIVNNNLVFNIADLSKMKVFANLFALCLNQTKMVVILDGNLGAGKTTLVKFILQCLGCVDSIKSPTYNLVHQYTVLSRNIYHLDLYRTEKTEELVYIDLQDFLIDETGLVFIEWGLGKSIASDLLIAIQHNYETEDSNELSNQERRIITLQPQSNAGNIIVNLLQQTAIML
jgi:tRNA threonylcarbamoyl adenosine modification protein YjeE